MIMMVMLGRLPVTQPHVAEIPFRSGMLEGHSDKPILVLMLDVCHNFGQNMLVTSDNVPSLSSC